MTTATSQGWGVDLLYTEFSELNSLTLNRYNVDTLNLEPDELLVKMSLTSESGEPTLDVDVFNLTDSPFTTLNVSEFDEASIQQEPQCCHSQMRKSTPEVRKHP